MSATDISLPTPAVPASGNNCFGCGSSNHEGLHLHFVIDATDPAAITATAAVRLTSTHEGAPGFIHGGIIATMLDEAMSKLNRPLRVVAMTRHMEVDYLRPVPVSAAITITGRHVSRDGRKLFHTAHVMDDGGHTLAKAKGVFVLVDPAMGFRPVR